MVKENVEKAAKMLEELMEEIMQELFVEQAASYITNDRIDLEENQVNSYCMGPSWLDACITGRHTGDSANL